MARAAIDAGLDSDAFLKEARRAFARAGDFVISESSPGRISSNSRIAALTGLARKEIPSLLKSAEGNVLQDSPLMELVREWNNNSAYLTSKKKPKILALDAGQNSFKKLVSLVMPDLPYVSVLKELERVGLVERSGSRSVALSEASTSLMISRRKNLEMMVSRLSRFSRSFYGSILLKDEASLNEEVVIRSLPQNLAALFFRDFSGRAKSLLDAVPKWKSANLEGVSGLDCSEEVSLGIYVTKSAFRGHEPTMPNHPNRRLTKRRATRA
ncbi:MAG: hypothetical protein RLZZ393_1801 [Pseudomonadota bacterium]|jgi:hypothetical protein